MRLDMAKLQDNKQEDRAVLSLVLSMASLSHFTTSATDKSGFIKITIQK